jgi:hypothetical protein
MMLFSSCHPVRICSNRSANFQIILAFTQSKHKKSAPVAVILKESIQIEAQIISSPGTFIFHFECPNG